MSDLKKPQKSQFAEIEEELAKAWQQEDTFAQSLKQREGQPSFSFYDGPPFANGLPHFGHSLVTSIKDALGRYKTMRGYFVPRRNGWDCHGLPVEYAIEKQLGVSGKKQIEQLGLAKFNAACRDSVFLYKKEWEEFYDRIGRWTDTKNAYATIDREYTESVWWVIQQVHQKGLLYKGYKSMPYCPRCETPLSNFEVNEGYRDNVPDPSLFVKFRLLEKTSEETNQPKKHSLVASNKLDSDGVQGAGGQRTELYETGTAKEQTQPATPQPAESPGSVTGSASKQDGANQVYLLAWTTTPWSLPGNAALAVNPKENYVYVQHTNEEGKTESLILAKKRLAVLDETDYSVIKEVKGTELVGLHYESLFKPGEEIAKPQKQHLYTVLAADFVSIEDGSGILHVAPAFGEDDLSLSERYDLPVLSTVDVSGHMVTGSSLPEVDGQFFKKADQGIIKQLSVRGLVFAAEIANHTYPFCYRCDSPLLYYAVSTWFIKVSAIKKELLASAKNINWTPSHIKDGRFGKWLEGARDWAISRNRYWGAPMPVWVNENDADDYLVIGSLKELKSLAGADTELKDLHRPYIDKVIIHKDGKTYRRVEEVLDCWVESGSMPVAQQHYPFTDKVVFEQTFPADYIGEGLDQTRLWFYVLHVLSTILFDRPAYKNVLVNGMIMAADGQKLSKRLKNYPPVEEVFATEGADSLRLYLLSNYQAMSADYMRFNREALKDLNRNVLGTLFNSFRFFQMYSQIDKWHPFAELTRPAAKNLLDQWLLARLDQTIQEVTEAADQYKLAYAVNPIFTLIDDMSNWYIRRSRKRFWKNQNDQDKERAYAILSYTLATTCQLLAPWAPFISDKIWRELGQETDWPKSVHLSDWPSVSKPDKASLKVLEEMKAAREIIASALAQRAEAKVKARQPLSVLTYYRLKPFSTELESIIADEVNVKQVIGEHGFMRGEDQVTKEPSTGIVSLDTEITPDLKAEGIARDLVRFVQNARKNADFNVEDRIKLVISSDSSEITEAVKAFQGVIFAETLATGELGQATPEHTETIKLDDQELTIKLSHNS